MAKNVADLHEVIKGATKRMAAKTEATAALIKTMDAVKEIAAKIKSDVEKIQVRHYFVCIKELQ